MMKYLLLILMFTGCAPSEEEKKLKYIKNKECVEVCISARFGDFHNSGSSWGTGSSSMSGLSQSEIYNRVVKHCEDYYKDEKCCQYNYNLQSGGISKIHSYNIGACR